jgi:hypothetical protein
VKFALTSETSSALEICKGIYNGKNKRGKTVSLRSTIIRENANLNKHNFATKYRLVYDKGFKSYVQFDAERVEFDFLELWRFGSYSFFGATTFLELCVFGAMVFLELWRFWSYNVFGAMAFSDLWRFWSYVGVFGAISEFAGFKCCSCCCVDQTFSLLLYLLYFVILYFDID